MATRAVIGNYSFVCAVETVITPVMVPGLAANRIKAVSDGFEFEELPEDADAEVLPLSMEKPIHDNTPPPATINASRDTPNRCSTLVPATAAMTRITMMARAALVASTIWLPRGHPATACANSIPQIAGLTRDRIVTIAWTCSFKRLPPFIRSRRHFMMPEHMVSRR